MEELEENWIMINDKIIYYYIKRKKIKNMYMRFTNEGKLLITASNKCTIDKIEKFIKQKEEWIFKQIVFYEQISKDKESSSFIDNSCLYFLGEQYKVKLISGNKNEIDVESKNIIITIKEKFITDEKYIKKVYENWLKEECLKIVEAYVEYYIKKMNKYKIPLPEIEIKKFKARWGCCIPKKGKIEFAMNLMKTPQECIEYVVVHELSHFKYIYHDKKFYDFVSLFIPDWKKRRDSLNKQFGRIIV